MPKPVKIVFALVASYVSDVRKEVDPHVAAWEAAGMMPLHDLFGAMARLGF